MGLGYTYIWRGVILSFRCVKQVLRLRMGEFQNMASRFFIFTNYSHFEADDFYAMARIYDNIDVKFEDGLRDIITNTGVKRVDFCVGYFNLRGWNLVCKQIDNLPGDFVNEESNDGIIQVHRTCRLLIGMHQPDEELLHQIYSNEEHIPDNKFAGQQRLKIAKNFRRQLLIGLPTTEDESTLRQLSAQMKVGKVVVKLYIREPLHAKLYLAHRPDDNFNKIQAILGSSNLTYSGLTKQGELNAEFADSDNARKLSDWFDDRWNDKFCIDITQELIKIIDTSWASEQIIPPYYVYLKAAYHLSQEARSGIMEFTLSPEFKRELFDFQQTAVKIAARHLRNEKRGGAMIGDVVGLGKTITACAIAKLYETTFASSTLIICPANLQDMWKKYAAKYDLKVEIMSMAKPIDVENSRYFRLIIIDESHNLRNGSSGSRYLNIKKLIDHQDSNVLLLTATPYNKDFRDLSNQLRLFIKDEQDLGIRPEAYIRKLGGERQFMQRHSDIFIRSIEAFEKSDEIEDWNELMKLFLVRRTRTFIKENYAKTDSDNGRKYLQLPDGSRSYFPDRKPCAIKFNTTPGDQYSRLYSEEMIDHMESLELPRYGLSNYINDKATDEASTYEKQIFENLSRAGQRMMGFAKSTFFKRIDSSGFSFLLTLYRHIFRNMVFIYALDNKLKLPIGDENSLPDEFYDDEDPNSLLPSNEEAAITEVNGEIVIPTDIEVYKRKAENYYNFISLKNNVSMIDSKFFKRTLKQKLKKDCETILQMIYLCGNWIPKTDQKLNELEKLLCETHKDEKIVVFTQYSDTANYIYRQLVKRDVKQIAVVTGDSDNPTSIVEKFSPISNEKQNISAEEQYRIIIATDVLSEGQNLQDSHIIVNFDLPWAIIRLIQRAGRVDRIGQTSNEISCYSFFPAEGVENIISLRKRLNERINANANIVGSDEIFFEGNEKNLKDMFNEKSGVLDEEEDGDVDLSSQAFQIWKNATDANPELARIIPALSNMIYSTKSVTEPTNGGVITYAKTYNDFDVLTWLSPSGEIISQSQKRILQAMACSIDTPAVMPVKNHHELVASAIRRIQEETANTSIGGMLGSHRSTRYRIIGLLEHYYECDTNLFFSAEQKEDLKYAIDDIYNYPLLETAKTNLGKMLNQNQNNDDIVKYVLELRKDNNLCRLPTVDNAHKDPSIICSLGLCSDK